MLRGGKTDLRRWGNPDEARAKDPLTATMTSNFLHFSGQAYIYMSRWLKAQKVRRVQDGYQKVAQAV